MRFPYSEGDLTARGAPEIVVPQLSTTRGGHVTRDVVFDQGGNPDARVRRLLHERRREHAAQDRRRDRALAGDPRAGRRVGQRADRADVLAFDPDGGHRRVLATGIRNCVSLAIHPTTHDVWCTTNERDELGDDLVPDYVTRVREGAFYGWPWFYIGANEDPRHPGERPDLAVTARVPDVLIQSHSAPLGMAFVPRGDVALPTAWAGDALVALHGSWNRARRTGYKVVRVRLRDGVPTGEYDDVMTGFVVDDASAWGRPVGVAIAHDGALLISTDDNGIIWRVAAAPPAR